MRLLSLSHRREIGDFTKRSNFLKTPLISTCAGTRTRVSGPCSFPRGHSEQRLPMVSAPSAGSEGKDQKRIIKPSPDQRFCRGAGCHCPHPRPGALVSPAVSGQLAPCGG